MIGVLFDCFVDWDWWIFIFDKTGFNVFCVIMKGLPIVAECLGCEFYSGQDQLRDRSDVHCFKLPCIGGLSHHIRNELSGLCKEFCGESFDIGLVFGSFRVEDYFAYKDPIPGGLKSFLVYEFACAGCSSDCIGETCRRFEAKIEEHIRRDNKSHVFRHLHSSETCFGSCDSLCFKMVDRTNSGFDLGIEEALHIDWGRPGLGAQQNHLALTLSL